jgi:hypothetical protein
MADVWFELVCEACSWRESLDGVEAGQRLRAHGMLRRDESPDPEVLGELLAGIVSELKCPECGVPGVRATRASDPGDWQDAVLCEICRKPIPAERLEAIPDTRRCTRCQADAESGSLAEEPEFCPRCGSPMVLRTSRGAGITRYKLFCTGNPPCRK